MREYYYLNGLKKEKKSWNRHRKTQTPMHAGVEKKGKESIKWRVVVGPTCRGSYGIKSTNVHLPNNEAWVPPLAWTTEPAHM